MPVQRVDAKTQHLPIYRWAALSAIHSLPASSNSRHTHGLLSYIKHFMVFRSKAEHQPSSNRAMVLPPHSSNATKFSGTPVSVMSITSKRQQQASQLPQVTPVSGGIEYPSHMDFPPRCTPLAPNSCVAASPNRTDYYSSLRLALGRDRRTSLTEKPMCDEYNFDAQ